MNAPISRSTAALLGVGTVAILALGAFSPFNSKPSVEPITAAALAPVVEPEPVAAVEPVSANLSPGLEEVVKLAQNHVDEAVILAYIRNSGLAYTPTADELLYLKDLGMPSTVLAALFNNKPAPITPAEPAEAPAIATTDSDFPPPAPAPVADASIETFHKALEPYGSWLQVPKYGLCWQPTAETVDPDWRPYVDEGQWQYTDNGWSWQSGYTWGAIAFHYGRWTQTGRAGWVWAPDTTWGPAWVSWRIALDYSGWAPLPPGVGLAVGAGLTYYNQRVSANYDFGIPAGWYTFVSPQYMLDPNLAAYAAQASQADSIFRQSVTVNNYSSVNHRIVNHGPGPATIAAAPVMNPPRTEVKTPGPRRKWEEPERVVADSLTGRELDAPADPPLPLPRSRPVTSGWSPWLSAPARGNVALPGQASPPLAMNQPQQPQKIHHREWARNQTPPAWENPASNDRLPRLEPLPSPANHERESGRREWEATPASMREPAAMELPRAEAPRAAVPAIAPAAGKSGH